MNNNIDRQYKELLEHIIHFGVEKKDRTGTGTISIFGWQIRHRMEEGFPLLTTKKMAWKSIVTELLWFLRGDTNIKYLVDNGCHIWDGDAYKNYLKWFDEQSKFFKEQGIVRDPWTKEQYVEQIKLGNVDADLSELGPIYGKQWRSWPKRKLRFRTDVVGEPQSLPEFFEVKVPIDQIANLISELKINPDSRRLMVNAWNVGELDMMVLPPCHYGFQVYTRELSFDERVRLKLKSEDLLKERVTHETLDKLNIPKRAISLMWNQRSVDTFLGLPFNIASYGLLLEIIAKAVNMVPEELIGNLGDVHLYSNHIEQAKEQLTRSSYELPKLVTNKTDAFWKGFDVSLFNHLEVNDFTIENYQSHPAIKAPLSN
jgi:thymidylate synthase